MSFFVHVLGRAHDRLALAPAARHEFAPVAARMSRMGRDAALRVHAVDDGLAIRGELHAHHDLMVAGRLALAPDLSSGAREVDAATGGDGRLERLPCWPSRASERGWSSRPER